MALAIDTRRSRALLVGLVLLHFAAISHQVDGGDGLSLLQRGLFGDDARRVEELRAKGRAAEVDTVLAELKARDAQDAGRALAPLRQAEDAFVIDTSDLDFEEQVARVLEKFRERQNETVV